MRLGHEVTLFASGDSETSARLVPACPRALWRDPDVRETLPHHVRLMELVFRDAGAFDVIHFHCDYLHFPLLRRHRCPSVTTLHGLRPPARPAGRCSTEYREVPLVSISERSAPAAPGRELAGAPSTTACRATCTFREAPGTYLAFLGRMSPEKRVDRAIEIARRAGHAAQDRRQDLPGGAALLRRDHRAAASRRRSRWSSSSARSAAATKDEFLGGALRCCSRSTGRSRSAW